MIWRRHPMRKSAVDEQILPLLNDHFMLAETLLTRCSSTDCSTVFWRGYYTCAIALRLWTMRHIWLIVSAQLIKAIIIAATTARTSVSMEVYSVAASAKT
eukprot:5566909-Pleurochrysis_carterae.AAC.1